MILDQKQPIHGAARSPVPASLAGSPVLASLAGALLVLLGPALVDAQESPMSGPSGGGTMVPLATELTGILADGGIPESLGQLKLLQDQQQKVARAAIACTVSVQIGDAQGCGVIITESGFVLTAAHVATDAKLPAKITLSDGRVVNATTRGSNRPVDAGLIKINDGQNGGRPWPHATLGTSDNLKAGMWCIATGHPGGYRNDRGAVSRVGRILLVRAGAIVTDCALIGGDSGGPLFDIAGRLIAVHSRIGNDVADNLHVPIDNYDESWKRLYNSEVWGFLPGFRPVLGVRGSRSSDVAEIASVATDSPADRAGVQVGDVIERFGKVSITDFESLKKAVDRTMPGQRVILLLKRGDDLYRLRVEIGRAVD